MPAARRRASTSTITASARISRPTTSIIPAQSIVATLKDGPFRHLHCEWTFRALAPHACKIELTLAYEFKTHVLETIVGPVFNHIANTFVDAFVRRAEAVYARAQ